MDYTLQIIVVVFVVVCAIALLMQFATLFGMYLAIKKLQGQVTQIWPQIENIVGITKRTADSVEKHVAKIGENTNIIVDVTRQQVVKIDDFLNDATTRAKVQMERAEMVLDDTMGRAQETVSIVQRTVLKPIREINGVLSGVRTTLAHLGRGSRPTVDHAPADEEMFI
jgi:hypothetical protein